MTTWHELINAKMSAAPVVEEDEMWVLTAEVPAGKDDEPGDLLIGLPWGRKSARVDFWLDCDHKDGAGLWGAQAYEGGAEAIGLWANGNQWELWLPGRQRSNTGALISNDTQAIHIQNNGPKGPVHVTISGT
jgi:hypothetical protein